MPLLSTLKTPQQITGAIIKSVVPVSTDKSRVYTVSVTPCTAMKFEARRDSMTRKGISDIDTVLTVRELARLIILYGIDITNIDPEPADEPMSQRSSSALLARDRWRPVGGCHPLTCCTGRRKKRLTGIR